MAAAVARERRAPSRPAEARPREETVREAALRGPCWAPEPDELPAAGPALWRPESPVCPAGPARRGAGRAGVPRLPPPRARPSGRETGGGGGKSEVARSGGPFLLRASAAGLPWPSPPPFPVPQCRHRPRPAALRRALPSPPPFPLLSRARPRGMVGGGSPPGPRCAAGPALGVPWTPRPGSEGVRGSAAHPRERPVLRGPLRAVRANPGFLWSRSDSSSRSFRRDARSALAGLRGCYVILQQRNWLQQMHV